MASKLNIVVLVSGRGSNLQAIINACKQRAIKASIACVISNKSDALALKRAQKAKIATLVIESKGRKSTEYNHDLLMALKRLKPDLIVLAGYMKILPQDIVTAYFGRIVNIHPSLLPAFPGLHAQQQAIDAGVKIAGCTVHFVDGGCDTGPIILQKSILIKNNDSAESLSKRLLPHEHRALVETIQLIEKRKVILQGNKTLVRK